jgi:ABC-type tungstate transport system substrate-binding protein
MQKFKSLYLKKVQNNGLSYIDLILYLSSVIIGSVMFIMLAKKGLFSLITSLFDRYVSIFGYVAIMIIPISVWMLYCLYNIFSKNSDKHYEDLAYIAREAGKIGFMGTCEGIIRAMSYYATSGVDSLDTTRFIDLMGVSMWSTLAGMFIALPSMFILHLYRDKYLSEK